MLSTANNELRSIIKDMIEDILKFPPCDEELGKAESINVDYYTESQVVGYDFYGTDGDGYGRALSLSTIRRRGKTYSFIMNDEEGDEFDDRSINDFDTTELEYVMWMLEGVLGVVEKEGKVNTEMDWDYS